MSKSAKQKWVKALNSLSTNELSGWFFNLLRNDIVVKVGVNGDVKRELIELFEECRPPYYDAILDNPLEDSPDSFYSLLLDINKESYPIRHILDGNDVEEGLLKEQLGLARKTLLALEKLCETSSPVWNDSRVAYHLTSFIYSRKNKRLREKVREAYAAGKISGLNYRGHDLEERFRKRG